MIKYLLDTDVTSQAGKAKPNKNVLKWLDSVHEDELAISVITLRERLEGAETAKLKRSPVADDLEADVEALAEAFQSRVMPIEESAARHWARLLVPDGSKSDDKAQIAIAAANDLIFVTLNWRDARGRGVPVLNPGCNPPKLYPP